MLVETSKLYDKIRSICFSAAQNKAFILDSIKDLKTNYRIPEEISNDILSLRVLPDQYQIEILFCVLNTLNPKLIPEYFTKLEIDKYSKFSYKEDRLRFPLQYRMAKVADDQYIGIISVKDLVRLRDAQIIRYNADAQRPLVYVNNGEQEYYKIDINRSAVKSIAAAMLEDRYIPDTITLNMPEDADIEYDEEAGLLKINEIDHFDLTDGYHRYVALNRVLNDNPKYDKVLELRLVTFPVEKARQFVWQADQKTKMKKVVSESFNQYLPSNQVVDALKRKPLFKDLVSNDIVNLSVLGALIRSDKYKNKETASKKEIISDRDWIFGWFQELIDTNPELADHKWEDSFLCAFYYAAKHNKGSDLEYIKQCQLKLQDLDMFKQTYIRKFTKLYQTISTTIERG